MKIATVLSLALVFPLLSPAAAQPEPESITRVSRWIVKPGMGTQLQEGIKRHNEWHRKQNDSWTLSTFTVESGANAGQYLRITSRHRWADFDAEEQWGPADAADSAVNLDPYHDPGGTLFYALLQGLSRPPEGDTPPPLAEVLTFHLQMGRSREFMNQMKKVHDAIQKTDWPVRYLWYGLVNGGEDPTFVLVLPRRSWADMKQPEVSFNSMLEQAYGRDDAEAMMKSIDASVDSLRSEIVRYHPELSYVPAKR